MTDEAMVAPVETPAETPQEAAPEPAPHVTAAEAIDKAFATVEAQDAQENTKRSRASQTGCSPKVGS